MREEGFMPAGEDVRLTVELVVPSAQVGGFIQRMSYSLSLSLSLSMKEQVLSDAN